MRQKLFIVEDRFKISGRNGTILASDSRPDLPEFKIGDNILLVRPDNSILSAEINEIDMPLTVSGTKKVAILVNNVTKEDVPVGTEIFLVN